MTARIAAAFPDAALLAERFGAAMVRPGRRTIGPHRNNDLFLVAAPPP
jgi:hypothetical protein